MKTYMEFSLVNNFKKLTIGRLFSLNFLIKSPWPSPIEIWVLQPTTLQKKCRTLVFRLFSKHLLHHIIFCGYIFTISKELVRILENKTTRTFWEFIFVVELLANSVVVCIVTLCFEHDQEFHISAFTYHLRYDMITDHRGSCPQYFNEYVVNYVFMLC